MTIRSIDPTVFRIEPTLCLLGGRSRSSGRFTFPLPQDLDEYELVEFPSTGVIWSYTVQRMAPKAPPYRGPMPFEPFAVGYVELPETLIIEARLTGFDFAELHIGLPVALTAVPLYRDDDGTQVLTFAFAPPAQQSA